MKRSASEAAPALLSENSAQLSVHRGFWQSDNCRPMPARGHKATACSQSSVLVLAAVAGLAMAGLSPQGLAQPPGEITASRHEALPDPAELKKLIKQGQAKQVLSTVRDLVAADRVTSELALIGADAAFALQDFGQAGSLGAVATSKGARDADGKPKEWRGFAAEGHALYLQARRAAERSTGTGGSMIAATYLDAGVLYGEARQYGGDPYEMGYFEAQSYLEGGNAEKALTAINFAVAAKPNDYAAEFLKARILIERNQTSEAVTITRKLVTAYPNTKDAVDLFFKATLAKGNRKEIAAAFIELVQRFPQDRPLYMALSNALPKARAFRRAIYRKIADNTPATQDAFPLWFLASLDESEGKPDDALQKIESYLVARNDAEGHLFRSRLLLGANRLDESREALLKAHELGDVPDERLTNYFQVIVGAFVAKKRLLDAAALQRLVVAKTLAPGDELNLATLLYNGGKREEGLSLMERLGQRGESLPSDQEAQVFNFLGLAYTGLDRPKEAETAFRRAVGIEGTPDVNALENLGVLLARTGRGQKATKWFEAALRLEPQRHRSRYNLLKLKYPSFYRGGE